MANPSGPPTRPRMFSVGSQKSSLSRKGSTNHGYDMQETPEEKARKTIKTKADPRMAILEDEPCEPPRLSTFSPGALHVLRLTFP